MSLDTLKQLYNGHRDARELDKLQDEHVNGAYNRYRAFFRALDGESAAIGLGKI